MKSARFPAYKDLSGFDFATSEINEVTVRTLHRCEFMDGAQNVVLIGGPPLDTPLALVLHREPKADVERYDGPRAQIAGGRNAS